MTKTILFESLYYHFFYIIFNGQRTGLAMHAGGHKVSWEFDYTRGILNLRKAATISIFSNWKTTIYV